MIQKLTFEQFPQTLQNIHNPPECLYMRGHLPDLATHKFLCVIGSRAYSSYGKEACTKLISGLAGYPISIVSGLAIGIDSVAHEAALEAGLHTTAFPGSGLGWNVIYPSSKRALAKRILNSGGAIVSEYEDWQKSGKWTFPQRNRLMAGIAQATLIIEACRGSGTLMTAKYAEESSRDLFVVPGDIFSTHTYGPHMLLRRGATAVATPEDILESLGFEVTKKWTRKELDSLPPLEQRIMAFTSSPVVREKLVQELNMPIAEANTLIADMELRGLIRENGDTVVRV